MPCHSPDTSPGPKSGPRTAAWLLAGLLIVTLMGCDSKQVLMIRVSANKMNMTCIDTFELTFRPTGDTSFSGDSSGSWSDGAITYGKDYRGGEILFVIKAAGAWVTSEIQKNLPTYPGDFVFEIPLKNIESKGDFEVSGTWTYHDIVTGKIVARPLTLPYEKSVFSLFVTREADNPCQPTNPPTDAETTPEEVVEIADPGEELESFEDIEAAEQADPAPDQAEVEIEVEIETEIGEPSLDILEAEDLTHIEVPREGADDETP